MSRIVVADRYKCGRSNGEYSVENKTLERKGLKVEERYVQEMNEGTADHGVLLVIDEEATKARIEAQESKGKTVLNVPKDDSLNEEKEALQKEYFELTQKEAKKTWGIARLTEEIAKEKGE